MGFGESRRKGAAHSTADRVAAEIEVDGEPPKESEAKKGEKG